MTVGVATHIGNRLGIFKDLETDEQGHAWGATLRMRVALNANIPLTRALKLVAPSGKELVVSFTHERLQILRGTRGSGVASPGTGESEACSTSYGEGHSGPGIFGSFLHWDKRKAVGASASSAMGTDGHGVEGSGGSGQWRAQHSGTSGEDSLASVILETGVPAGYMDEDLGEAVPEGALLEDSLLILVLLQFTARQAGTFRRGHGRWAKGRRVSGVKRAPGMMLIEETGAAFHSDKHR
ncbi:hypothetical protein Salat_2908200 [Sesamum alatum]|uniref:Uncharacterized protein n=1 Tax=Sesamum alatum TaxID=300844 RepID=A0AAE2C875_9LAMI|nr:hypothetical protein Salat_2908200 [Sesamum alatum]